MEKKFTFAERLRELLAYFNINQTELALKTGISKSSISRYIKGAWEGKQDAVFRIASAFGVSEAWLMGVDVPMFPNKVDEGGKQSSGGHGFPHPKVTDAVVTFPVIGEMAAGYEHIAAEDWSGDTVEVPKAYLHGRSMSDFIVLTVCGDSMYPAFMEGDKVLVLLTPELEYSGQVGLVRYDGEMATLKKIEYPETREWLRLVPINPNYPSRTISDEALADCAIIGVPRLIIRTVQ